MKAGLFHTLPRLRPYPVRVIGCWEVRSALFAIPMSVTMYALGNKGKLCQH